MDKNEILERLREILDMQEAVMMQQNGRPDCKNCSLAETIEDLVMKPNTEKEA